MPKAVIVGTGSYLPPNILSNSDLEKMVETNDEWIVTRTGMKERRIASPEEFTSHMGIKAAQNAFENASIDKNAVDLVLVATLTPDYVFPSTACLIQTALGLENAAAVDIQAACSGYVYGLSMAKAFIESGIYKCVLVVAAEKLSTIVDYSDRNTCVLFGDGASCALVQADGIGFEIGAISLGADGEQSDLIKLPAGGSRRPATKETVEERLHYLRMEGKETFKHAVRRMEMASRNCMDKMHLSDSDISWYVPHQANIRIIEAIAKRFEVPMERVYLTIQKYGNTSASSIGIALDELLHKETFTQGQNILLTAFGAGLTWGACILTRTK